MKAAGVVNINMTIENRDRLIEEINQPNVGSVLFTGVVESVRSQAVLNGKYPNRGLTFDEAEAVYQHCLEAEKRWKENAKNGRELYPGEYNRYISEGLGPQPSFQEYWNNRIQPDINLLTKS